MNSSEVTIVRIYLSEADNKLDSLLKRLRGWEKVRGVTVFRGINGFAGSGDVHTARLLDLSLDLPVVVEFFDEPSKARQIVEHISTNIKPRHMVWWSANMNEEN